MAASNLVDTAERCRPLSSSDPALLPAGRDDFADPDETTPLLRIEYAHRNRLEWLLSGRSVAWVMVAAFFDRNAGLLLVAASQFFLSATNLSVKWLNSIEEPIPILEVIWIRMVIAYVCAVAYLFWQKVPEPLLGPKGIRRLLALRGFSGFVGISGLYFSLQHLSLSDATVVTFISPILTGFAGVVFLKEPFSLRQMFSGACSFCGVILIARPQFLFDSPTGDPSNAVMFEQRMLSVTAGLLGVMGQTGTYIFLRAIGKRAHPLHSMMYFLMECVFASTISMIVFKITPAIPTDTLRIVMLLLISLLGFTAQTLLAMGLQRETASRGTLATYTSVVFAVIFELIFFHTTPSALSIAGMVIIMSSAIYTSVVPFHSSHLDRSLLTYTDQENHPRP